MRILVFILTLIAISSAHAESYRDIGPLDNLGDIKNKFPNANIEKLSPGWAQETDALYKISGAGISGWIIVKFDDFRPKWKEEVEKNPTSELHKDMASQSDEKALSVNWVRWVPDTKIPIQRLISKYGKPDKSGFSDENYQPYRSWNRGLEAYLTDDEKYVERIDYFFTKDENRKAYLAKFKFAESVPPWLDDKPARSKKK